MFWNGLKHYGWILMLFAPFTRDGSVSFSAYFEFDRGVNNIIAWSDSITCWTESGSIWLTTTTLMTPWPCSYCASHCELTIYRIEMRRASWKNCPVWIRFIAHLLKNDVISIFSLFPFHRHSGRSLYNPILYFSHRNHIIVFFSLHLHIAAFIFLLSFLSILTVIFVVCAHRHTHASHPRTSPASVCTCARRTCTRCEFFDSLHGDNKTWCGWCLLHRVGTNNETKCRTTK